MVQQDKRRLFRGTLLVLFVAMFSMCAMQAQAGGYFAKNPDDQPSVFTYGLRGLGVGTLDGMAAGYLVIHTDASEMADWRVFLVSMGIGALGGAALGLTTGFVDVAMYSRYPNGNYVGMGAIILRDSLYGALFGALLGTIGGGVGAILKSDAQYLPLGAAIGALAGTGLGILIGVIEGRVLTRRHRADRRASLQFLVIPVMTERQHMIPAIGFGGTFR
ncbi:MAG: hypothetical protein JXX14_21300 [Deltaproteobacteria bacterium]|nr:hypothetical protein [Deltaproteobacteria bacterium]